MPETKTRVVGSGYTTFTYNGRTLAFLDSINDSGQDLIGGTRDVQPLAARYPVEIVKSRALRSGIISITIIELWNEEVWQQIEEFADANDLLDVFDAFDLLPGPIVCQRVIRPPNSNTWRVTNYHNCTVTGISDSDQVGLGDLTVSKGVTMAYTRRTRDTVPAQ